MKLAYFSAPAVRVEPNQDVMMSRSQNDFVLDDCQPHYIYGVKPNSDTILAYQNEIEVLKNKITRLQSEKSVLIKWVKYLF